MNTQNTQTQKTFLAFNYMTNANTIREGLYKLPLIVPKQIQNDNDFSKQKRPNIPPKRLLKKEDLECGFNNVAFNGLEFQRPKMVYENKIAVSYEYHNKEIMNENTSYGLLTGSLNKLVVIDLDTSKPVWNELKNEHPFIKYYCDILEIEINEDYKITIENIIKKINTFSVKTQSGGFHLYFKSEHAGSYPNTQSKNLEIDIRGEGGFVVGAYSKIYDVEGNEKFYLPFTNVEVKELDVINNDFVNMLYDKTGKTKCRKDKINLKKNLKYRLNDGLWNYEITDEQLKFIEDHLPLKFFQSWEEYFKLTTFYKIINRHDEWDKISKANQGYNYKENLDMWNSANCEITCVEYVLKSVGKLHYLPYMKNKPLTKNKIKADEIVNSENTKGLSDVLELESDVNYIIKSGTATGKTYLFNKYHHEQGNPILSITSRVSLAQEHRRVFSNFNNDEEEGEDYILYSEHRGKGFFHFEDDNMIIQIDSIEKISSWDFSNYIVFVDELNSVYEYLMSSSTLQTRRKNVMRVFCKIIRECKQFIGVDADISDPVLFFLNPEKYLNGLSKETIEDFKEQSPNIEVKYIENTHKHYKGTPATELFNYDDLVNNLILEDKYMVCCDSATECRNLRNKLLELEPDQNIVVIDRLYDEEMDLDKIDKVIFSPKIVYGLDSQMKRKVFCYFKGHTIPAKSMLQQIARCRNIEHLYYYFIDKSEIIKDFEFNKSEDVVDRVKYLENYITSYFKTIITEEEHDAMLLKRQSFYNYLISLHLYNDDCDTSNKFYHFRNGLKNIGYELKTEMKQTYNIKKKEFFKLKELTEHELTIHYKSNFDDNDYYKRIQEVVNIPNTDKHKNIYEEIFVKPQALQEHLNYCNLFFKDTTLEDLKEEWKKKEFSVNVSTGDLNKINWIKNLMEKCKLEKHSLFPTETITKEEASKLKTEYLELFRHQGNKNKIDFTDKYFIGKTIQSSIEKICGDSPYVSKKINIKNEDGKRTSKMIYEMGGEGIGRYMYHKKLASFRCKSGARVLRNLRAKMMKKNALNNFFSKVF